MCERASVYKRELVSVIVCSSVSVLCVCEVYGCMCVRCMGACVQEYA